MSVTGDATMELDGNNTGGGGGTSLTIGGTLTNSSSNSNGVSIGNTSMTSAETLTVKGAGGLSTMATSTSKALGYRDSQFRRDQGRDQLGHDFHRRYSVT